MIVNSLQSMTLDLTEFFGLEIEVQRRNGDVETVEICKSYDSYYPIKINGSTYTEQGFYLRDGSSHNKDIMNIVAQNLESLFNFSQYTYSVCFEEVDSDWLSRLFGGKKTHLLYYIRRNDVEKGHTKNSILHYYSNIKLYSFVAVGSNSTIRYWKTSTEPEDLLTRLKYKVTDTNDNVIFSTKDL